MSSTYAVEVNSNTQFSASLPSLMEVTRELHSNLVTDDANLSKQLVPEYIDYYGTVMMWLRLVHIKRSNSEPTTQIEDQIIDLVNNTPFTLPEPLYLAVKSLGNVTTPTGAHLYLKSPAYPTQVVAGLGGFYGTLNEEAAPEEEEEAEAQQAREARNVATRLRHNLYEELPCPGVLAYAVQQSISNANPGNYQSTVTLGEHQPNANLLGFRALAVEEQKQLLLLCARTY